MVNVCSDTVEMSEIYIVLRYILQAFFQNMLTNFIFERSSSIILQSLNRRGLRSFFLLGEVKRDKLTIAI